MLSPTGYQMLSGVCVEQGTGRRVAEDLCDHAARPIPVILNCNDDACPTRYVCHERREDAGDRLQRTRGEGEGVRGE